MNAVTLPVHRPRAVAAALTTHGWELHRAEAAAQGLGPIALHITEVPSAAVEALVRWNARAGLDLLTGEDWVLLAGSESRLGALARPWTVPPELAEVAVAVGLALPHEVPATWPMARGNVALDRPIIVGIVNVTPDSFSDGGKHATLERAVGHAEELLQAGAVMLDIGGESSRPGATVVAPEEEMRRVVPVIKSLASRFPTTPFSIDTVKSEVARAALDAGAWAVNDVSGLRLDPAIAPLCAERGAGLILMHSRGAFAEIATFAHADYPDGVVAGVARELKAQLSAATAAGVAAERIAVDPGFGFSKTAPQNLELLDQLGVIASIGRPLLVGPLRKRFLGHATGREVDDRDRATAAACAMAWERGARLFRVHAPAAVRDALELASAAERA